MIKRIKSKIKNKRLIIFGETHGTKEIPEMLTDFFLKMAEKEEFNIGLEIPDEFQEKFDFYMNSGDYELLSNIAFFSKEYCTDGRNSLEYLNLIKKIYNFKSKYHKNIKIYCISPSLTRNQEEYEHLLAENILKIADKKTFAVIGNVHSSKKEIYFPEQKIITAGSMIYKKMGNFAYFVLLDILDGEIFNGGLKKIVRYKEDQFEQNFDYIFKIEKVSPCSFLK